MAHYGTVHTPKFSESIPLEDEDVTGAPLLKSPISAASIWACFSALVIPSTLLEVLAPKT